MKRFAFLAVLVLSTPIFAQQQPCSCSEVFEKLTVKIETEYPGFEYKTKDFSTYSDFKESLAKEAEIANGDVCSKLLKKYTD